MGTFKTITYQQDLSAFPCQEADNRQKAKYQVSKSYLCGTISSAIEFASACMRAGQSMLGDMA
jgi:hypothetical protein